MSSKNSITYTIKTNDDWNNLKEGELVVDISNNAYFGYRAMEKGAKAIVYDPEAIDTLVRLGKESKKFPNTKHILVLDKDTLGYNVEESEESFLKASTRVIEGLFELNHGLFIDFLLKTGSELDEKSIYSILSDIYNVK